MGFNYVNSCDDYPENNGLGFAKYEKVTKTMPSVARVALFVVGVDFFSGCCSRRTGSGGHLQLRRSMITWALSR